MATQTPAERVTNQVIADAIGAAVATVSRLRSGDRVPSFAMMQKIDRGIGWSVAKQAVARDAGCWHLEFETACRQAKVSQ